jgi:hypothetical protein
VYEISAKANGGKMMIRNEQIISVIEKHLGQAKAATTNGEMREQLVAIKALCDVLLMNDAEPSTYKQVQSTQVTPSPAVSSSSKLHEDDGANGDSIFDF